MLSFNRKKKTTYQPKHLKSFPAIRPEMPMNSVEPIVSETDVNGSYTGNPKGFSEPVQDADDL